MESIREAYQYSRELALSAPDAESWESVGATEARLAQEYGVSVSTVHSIVLGLTYPDAPGPIDTERRASHEAYQADVARYGVEVARSRQRERTAVPAVLQVTVTAPDGTTSVEYHPEGTVVSVALVSASSVE